MEDSVVFRILDKNLKPINKNRLYSTQGAANNVASRYNNSAWWTHGPYTVQEGVVTWQGR